MSDSKETAGTQGMLRDSQPWTEASNAAGFVIRYLSPMRAMLIEAVGSEPLADRTLTLFLQHLVSKGYGNARPGRLRDYLIVGLRSALNVSLQRLPADQIHPDVNWDVFASQSTAWRGHWRRGLLELAWRRLEQHQHKHPEDLDYTLLRAVQANPTANETMLAVQVSAVAKQTVDANKIPAMLVSSRNYFAGIVVAEIASTLSHPTTENIQAEQKSLKLT